MNYRGRKRFGELRECAMCGMDAGKRKVKQSGGDTFYVVCEACGHRTKGFASQGAATREWNRGDGDGQ